MFCHVCITAIRQLKLQPTTVEASFLYKGCQNCKDVCVVFPRHKDSLLHKLAVEAVITLPAIKSYGTPRGISKYPSDCVNCANRLVALVKDI